MTIQDLGSLGELIAAVATVATLLYLGLQLRANAAAVHGEARVAHRAIIESASLAIAQDPQLAALFRAGLTDFSALTPDQHVQFTFLLGAMVNGLDAAHEQFESGLLKEKHLDHIRSAVEPFLLAPGGRAWWATYSTRYSPPFREFITRAVLATDEASASISTGTAA